MVVVALLSVYLVESVDLVSVYLVVNCNDIVAALLVVILFGALWWKVRQ